MAKSMWNRQDPDKLLELIANGNIGLLLALDKFDPKYGTRFCTYAGHWVLMTMRRTFAGLVRVPPTKPQAQYEDSTAIAEGSYESDYLADIESRQQHAIHTMWMRFLSQRERYILASSYCLNTSSSKPKSLRLMSKDLGLSSERVRQLRSTALDKLALWLT